MERDRREKKRKYRLIDATNEAFAHVQAVNTNNSNFKVQLKALACEVSVTKFFRWIP